MDDLRCQMCGKPNPGDAVECQYCGARLKPLIAPPSSEDSSANWADASQENTLGWLRSLGQDDDELDELAEEGTTADLPDWLGGEPASSTPSQPAWMEEGEGDFDDDSSTREGWGAPEPQDALPSWLSDQDDERLEKTVPLDSLFPASSPPEEDWLHSIGNEESLTATLTDWKQPAAPGAHEMDDLPNWLTSSPGEEGLTDSGGFDEDLPSWLSSGRATPTTPPAEYPPEPELEGEFPDWLETLNSKTGMTGKLGEMPEWLEENEPAEEPAQETSLDWLATLGDTPEPEENVWESDRPGRGSAMGGLAFDPEDSFISEVNQDENPDWLQGLQGSDSGAVETAPEYSGFQASWGFDQKASPETWQETEPEEGAPSSIEDSGIASGLPSWVKAFRPMDGADIATEYTEGELERVGPLAGLRGLLTPEADISKTSKPSAYSDVLQVSASQQTNTQLLESLVQAENIPQSLPEGSPLTSQNILRIVFGAVLILIMLFPLVSGTARIALPAQPLPQELQAIENLSNSSPLDRPILVALDYEPGLSGELEVAAKALFHHWMDRGIPLAFVSTSPIGAGLGERLVQLLRQYPYEHHYVYGENYVNLGYIAGGTAGLANFALIPRQSIQMSFDDHPIWELFEDTTTNPWFSPVMQPIVKIGDFPMTVVLTDNPETARSWIEQVAPALRRNSLVMVVSTQAEPFVRPYFENPDPARRQVEGLLVGLRGGAWYENDQGTLGLARLYWDTFGVGLLVAVFLILAGGGYNYLDELRRASRKTRKAKSRK